MRKIESLETIRQVEFNILEHFDSFCRENNITYFLSYGSLIGAIRHQGFIPWDDDIDVCMLREDYLKFIKSFKDSKYKVLCPEKNNKKYTYAWAKLINSETRLIENFQPEVELGIHIDIFPLDYLGSDKSNIETIKNMLIKRYKRINYLETGSGLKGTVLKIIGRRNLSHINRLLNRFNNDNSSYVANVVDLVNAPIFNKEWFSSTIEVRFQDKLFLAPRNYDEVLKTQYGDYMKLPPESERVSNHDFKAYWK